MPAYQIIADGVSPVHISPAASHRIVLEKEVILTLVINQSVGVVEPALSGGEVQQRARRLGYWLRLRLTEAEAFARFMPDADVKPDKRTQIVIHHSLGKRKIDVRVQIEQQSFTTKKPQLGYRRGG